MMHAFQHGRLFCGLVLVSAFLALEVWAEERPPTSGALSACLDYYAAGNSGWCKLSDHTFDEVRLSDEQARAFGVKGSGGSKAVMIAWTGAAIDREREIMYFNGGGHNDYYGNEWYAYDLSAGVFERLNAPSPLTHYYYNKGYKKWCLIPDPQKAPPSAHSYDGLEFHPERGTIIMANQGTSAFCTHNEPKDLVKTTLEVARRGLWEFNPSKTESRAGLPPLGYRRLGSHEYGYPRSEWVNGRMYFGSNQKIFEITIKDDGFREVLQVAGNAAAGQGVLTASGNRLYYYMSSGWVWYNNLDLGTGNDLIRWTKPPVGGQMECGRVCLVWGGAEDLALFDLQTNQWRLIEHDEGPNADRAGTGKGRVYSKWRYLPKYDVFIGVAGYNQPVWAYKYGETGSIRTVGDIFSDLVELRGKPFKVAPAVSGQGFNSVNVEGQGPFSLGLGLPKGGYTQPQLNKPNTQVICRIRWNDGSCKFAAAAGYASGHAQIVEGAQAQTPLTAIDTSGVSVQIEGQAVTPGEPYQTEAGPVMIEGRYRVKAGDLLVLFYIQQFRDGERHVTVAVENGYLNQVTEQADYTAVVTVGEQSRTYQINQGRNTRWVAEVFDGQFAKARQDVASLMASGLVPSYTISPNAAPGSYQSYQPFEKGNHTASMGATGYQPQIGLLPQWDAAYLANPSEEAYASVIANAYAIGSYRIVWRDADDSGVVDPEKFGKWTVSGENRGGVTQLCGNGLCWERAHFPSTGYLAYLLTANPVHLDTLAHTASTCYLVQSWGYGGGIGLDRLDKGQTRGQAWCWRSAGMYAALSGDSGLKTRFARNMAHYAGVTDQNELGISYYDGAYGKGKVGPWQQNFRVQTLGFLSDIEPLDDMSDLIALRDFNYRWPVGLLGEKYCRAGKYTLRVGPDSSTSIGDFYDWSEIDLGAPCKGKLSKPTATNYWANLLPAISYAVKHSTPGAAVAWKRLQGASNFKWWMNRFSQNPVWGVLPDS